MYHEAGKKYSMTEKFQYWKLGLAGVIVMII
jgi:hypothetical protein